ncbi:MAG: T9SS type A sorting domain-containing protein [Imperialibacter sp.]|uniref:T9SS type A sorting domain-containing protein n=1 Tax=Imperialibacter sp. TaxID=2038411 RepID=UPI0032EF0B72
MTDAAGNPAITANSGDFDYDISGPVMTSLEIRDTNFDGFIDAILFTFNENVDTDNSALPASGDFGTIKLPDNSNANLGAATFSDPAGSSNTILITGITGQLTKNTTIGSTSISGTLAGGFVDAQGNPSTVAIDDAVTVVDGAGPVILSAKTTTLTNVQVTFSESLVLLGNNTFFGVTGLGVTNAALDGDPTKVNLTVTGIAATDYSSAGSLSINVSAVEDAAGVDNGAQAGFNVTDGIAPTVASAVTRDNNSDGKIDRVVITFSENLTAGSIDTDGGSDDFTVAGYTVASVAVTATNQATLTLTQGAIPDTGTIPTFSIIASQVQDAVGNFAVAASGLATADGAPPVILASASTMQSTNAYLEVVFSEVVVKQGGGALSKTDFTVTPVNGAATVTVNTTLVDAQGVALTAAGQDTIRFNLTVTPSVLSANGTESVTVAVNGVLAGDAATNIILGTTGAKNLFAINPADLVTIASAVPQSNNSYITITFSQQVLRDNTTNRAVMLANSTDGRIDVGGYDNIGNGTSDCSSDELCIVFNPNGSGVTLGVDNSTDIEWFRGDNNTRIMDNTNYSGPVFRLYLNDIKGGLPSGSETITLKARDQTQIHGITTDKYMLETYEFTFNLADQRPPAFSPAPLASGNTVIGSPTIFSSDEFITITANLAETGLTVTADLTSLLSTLSAVQPLTHQGGGVYSYQVPIPAKFLNNGVRNVPITAKDAANNTTVNSTLNVTIDSQGPALTVNSLITTDQTPLLEGLATGAASVSITIDGPGGPYGPYVSGGAVTLSGGSWSLNVPTTLPFGTYSVNVTGLDAESNSSADITNNELLISNGVNITGLNLPQICVDGGYQTGSFAITETQNGDIQQGTSRVFSVQLPNGFVFNTAVIPTFSDTQGGGNPVTGSVSFPASNVLRVTYTASAGSVGQLNDITITNVQVATNLASATATDDLLNLGGTASILGLDVGTDLGDVGSIQPGAPVASTPLFEYYTENYGGYTYDPAANANPISITGNNAGVEWYTNSTLSAKKAGLDGLTAPGLTGANGWGFTDVDAKANIPDSPGGIITYWVTQTVSGCRSSATKVTVAATKFGQSNNTTYFTDDDDTGITLTSDLPAGYTGVYSGAGLGAQTTVGSTKQTKFIPKTAGIGSFPINYTLTNSTTLESVTKTRNFTVSDFTSIFAENNNGSAADDIPTDYCRDISYTPYFDAFDGDVTGAGRRFYSFALYSSYDGYTNVPVPDLGLPGFPQSPNLTGTVDNKVNWRVNLAQYKIDHPNDQYFYIFRYTWDGVNVPYYYNFDAYQIVYLRPIPTVTIANLNATYCAEAGTTYDIEAQITNAGYTGTNITSWTNYKLTNITAGNTVQYFNGSSIDMHALANNGSSMGGQVVSIGLGTLPKATYRLEVVTSAASDPNPEWDCPATAVRNFTLYREAVAPILSSGIYSYSYCSDQVLTAGVFDFNSPDFAVPVNYTFYDDASGAPGNAIEQNDAGILNNFAGVGLSNLSAQVNPTLRRKTIKFHVTQTYKDIFQACEGDFRTVTINLYHEPVAPVVQSATLVGSSYVIEYCQGETVNSITLDAATLDSSNPSNSKFSWYANSDFTGFIDPGAAGGLNDVASASDLLIDTNTPGIYDFYVTQSDYLNEFAGCTSVARKVEVRIVQSPTAPSLTETAIYTCQNNAVGNISAPAETGVAYQWYIDDGDQVAELGGHDVKFASATNIITNADLVGAGFNPANSGFTYVWVTKLQDQNITTSFAGCEGPPTKVTITVYPEAGVPTIVDNVNSGHGPVLPAGNIGGVPVYEFKYCIEDVTTSVEFQVSDAFAAFTGAGETRKYSWYQAALNGGGTAIVKAVSSPMALSGSDTERKTANASDLFLIGSPPSERYFLISQTTNIRGDGKHLGCESNLVALKVTLYGTPGTPTDASGTNDYYYCNGATIDNITMNGAGGATFNWYNVDPLDNPSATPIFQGSSASAANLSINNSPANQVLEQTSVFYVTQVVNIDNGITPPFVGCESNRRRISVTVVPIPPEPVMASVPDDTSPRYAMCEGDAVVPSFSIANRFPGATVQFWDVDRNIPLTATNSSFTPSVVNYPPSSTVYNFKVTQTIRDDVFAGCESSVEFFTFYHAPIAGVPHTTGTNDVYTYCIGEEIGNLQIDANINSIFTYRWFSDVNLNNLLTTTTSVNNDVVPSLNPTFDAKKAGTYTYYVTSEVTGQGCQSAATKVEVVINSLPVVTMTFDDELSTPVPSTYAICVDNGPFNLVGSLAGTLAGTFKGTGITDNGDGTATFNPLLAVGLTDPQKLPADENPEFTVTYTLTNSNGCVDSLQRVVRVKPLTVVDFSSTISFDDENSKLLVDVSESQVIRFTGNQSNGTFTGTGTTTTSLTTAVFAPLAARGGDLYGANTSYPITYGSSGTNGCYNEITKTVTVQPIPQIDLVVSGGCSSFDIDLTANVPNAEALGGVSAVEWTIKGDAANAVESVIGTGTNFIYTEKPAPGNYFFKAKVTGVNGAVNSVQVLRNIGSSPDPYIAWRHIVAGSPTIFSFDNRILPDQFLKYMKLEWITASGNVLIMERSSNPDTQNSNDFARAYFDAEYGGFTFPGEGDYTVRLTMVSVNECVATTERVVHILPLVSVGENFTPHSFEAGTDGWWVDNTFLFTPTADKFSKATRPNDWETGTSGGQKLNSASVGQRAMFTKAGGVYQINQTAWVMSPAFDLSALTRPMVSFDRMFLTEDRKDGVVFQYSINNGDTWQVLGSYEAEEAQSTGENWYTVDGISSDPGSQDFFSTSSNRVGWAGKSLKAGQVDFTYASARQKLDMIPGDKKRVIFRFALASNATKDGTETGLSEEGFAFDNFWIGNRTKQVLLEKFSSTTNSLSNNVDTQFQNELAVLANNNNDIIPIAYHTEFKGGEGSDPFNQLNKADAGSRVLFYGITDVPTSILSGNVSEETYRAAGASGRPFSDLELSRSSLRDPLASISIEQLSAGDTDLSFNVKVSRKVSTNGALPSSGEHRLYVAIVEDSLEFQGKPYQSVMRKLLPNGNGEIISGFAGLSTETVLTFPYTWEISGKLVKDPDHLKVVAFIQSNDTKLIYQAASLDIKGKQATETGVDLPGEIASSYALYPNPANTEVGVRFDSQLNNDFEWRLIDQAGATISNGRVQKGSEAATFDTRSVPSGMYFVIISNENARFEPKKLLIIH